MNRLGDIASKIGRISNCHDISNCGFVRWAMQLLSMTVQRENAEMYRRSALITSREQWLPFDAHLASGDIMMGHRYGSVVVAVLVGW